MLSSQNKKSDIILPLYSSSCSIFRLKDIAMLTGLSNFESLNQKLNYAVRQGKLLNPRKGIYAKPGYSQEELACSIFTPSYISLEYVLQKAGLVFQYDAGISSVSYLSRSVEIEKTTYSYRKIKAAVLLNLQGIQRLDNKNIAIPERAFLDLVYLEKEYYPDHTDSLDHTQIEKLLPIYQSKALNQRVAKILSYG